jgi:DNA-binding IclR family transcriptional regulator
VARVDAALDGLQIVAFLQALRNEHMAIREIAPFDGGRRRLLLSISRGLAETDHLWRGASGKAILAFLDDDEIADVTRRLPKTINKAKLAADLSRARADGYFVSRGEVFVGAIAIAARYFDHTGNVAGSVGVFGPDARLDEGWVAKAASSVVKSAAELSAASGHVASTPKASTK